MPCYLRFGHSMIPTHLPSRDENRNVDSRMYLHEVFNNGTIFETKENAVDDIIRGQTGEPAAAWDAYFNKDFVNKLFAEESDLIALNVNRGRDHGLPGYNTYRRVCRSGSGKVNSFDELKRDGSLTSVSSLTYFL